MASKWSSLYQDKGHVMSCSTPCWGVLISEICSVYQVQQGRLTKSMIHAVSWLTYVKARCSSFKPPRSPLHFWNFVFTSSGAGSPSSSKYQCRRQRVAKNSLSCWGAHSCQANHLPGFGKPFLARKDGNSDIWFHNSSSVGVLPKSSSKSRAMRHLYRWKCSESCSKSFCTTSSATSFTLDDFWMVLQKKS